jgi:hypothetical protein
VLDDSPSNRFRAYRDAWFAHVVSDSAAFKQFLSIFSLYLQRLDPSAATEVGDVTVSLHMQALRSVNERILGLTVAGDEGLLVVIMTFTAHYVRYPLLSCSFPLYEHFLIMAAIAGEVRCVADAYPGSQRHYSYLRRT